MKIQFLSKIYTGAKKKFSFVSWIIVIVCIIMIVCMGLKCFMGDFNPFDLVSMLSSLLIIFVVRNNCKENYHYIDTDGEIIFEKENMKITYANIYDDISREYFSDETSICYDDIEVIEYGVELSCFRIVANCIHRRWYFDTQKEFLIENAERPVETFIYVFDEQIANKIRRKLQIVTKSIIRVIDEEKE